MEVRVEKSKQPMYESTGPSGVSPVRQSETLAGNLSESPGDRQINTATPIVSYRAPPQSEGIRNLQRQTSPFPGIVTNSAGPSTVPPVVFEYSGCALHSSGFQPKNQSNLMPKFGPPPYTGVRITLQPYGTAAQAFSRRPLRSQGYTTPVPPGVPYPARPVPPPLNQDVFANMIERMYGPQL